MTQMKRTPKKMRRRMKGGAGDELELEGQIAENEKILQEKADKNWGEIKFKK